MYTLHKRRGRNRYCVQGAIGMLLGVSSDEVAKAYRRLIFKARCAGIPMIDIVAVIGAMGYAPKYHHQGSDISVADFSAAHPDKRFVLIQADANHALALAGGEIADNGKLFERPCRAAECSLMIRAAIAIEGELRSVPLTYAEAYDSEFAATKEHQS